MKLQGFFITMISVCLVGSMLFLSGCSIAPPVQRPSYTTEELTMIGECRTWVMEKEHNKQVQMASIQHEGMRALLIQSEQYNDTLRDIMGKNRDICQPGGEDGYYKAYTSYVQGQKEISVAAIQETGKTARFGVGAWAATDIFGNLFDNFGTKYSTGGNYVGGNDTDTITEIPLAE